MSLYFLSTFFGLCSSPFHIFSSWSLIFLSSFFSQSVNHLHQPFSFKFSCLTTQKLEKLRIESESNNSRAEKAEQEVKELKAELAKKDVEVQNLNNKVILLQEALERSEKRIEEVKLKKAEGDKEDSQMEALHRKVAMLEHQLEEKEKGWRESTDKARALEVHSEHHERKAKQLDNEKGDMEKKYVELEAKYNAVKAELEQTLKSLEDL